MPAKLDEFRACRERMNDRILEIDHLGIKRFFNLDTAAYKDATLDGKTRELLGLVASNIALVVGGSIVIPHMRHAVETIDTLRLEQNK
ncbi:MAG: carboxymuconolactone decarboxylase family protein [Chloroflexi bacterium]|nr:carboxymuconolactone decarboxylase family protein [Chloroflexota bacterium]